MRARVTANPSERVNAVLSLSSSSSSTSSNSNLVIFLDGDGGQIKVGANSYTPGRGVVCINLSDRASAPRKSEDRAYHPEEEEEQKERAGRRGGERGGRAALRWTSRYFERNFTDRLFMHVEIGGREMMRRGRAHITKAPNFRRGTPFTAVAYVLLK